MQRTKPGLLERHPCSAPAINVCLGMASPAALVPHAHFSRIDARLMSAVVRNLTSRIASVHLQTSSKRVV